MAYAVLYPAHEIYYSRLDIFNFLFCSFSDFLHTQTSSETRVVRTRRGFFLCTGAGWTLVHRDDEYERSRRSDEKDPAGPGKHRQARSLDHHTPWQITCKLIWSVCAARECRGREGIRTSLLGALHNKYIVGAHRAPLQSVDPICR